LELKYKFTWKNRVDNKWQNVQKIIKAESDVEAWIKFFIWLGGDIAVEFLADKYGDISIKGMSNIVTLDEMKKIFNNFVMLNIMSELDELNMENVIG
jgi:hypothetical protein